jgi:hypothetical protein
MLYLVYAFVPHPSPLRRLAPTLQPPLQCPAPLYPRLSSSLFVPEDGMPVSVGTVTESVIRRTDAIKLLSGIMKGKDDGRRANAELLLDRWQKEKKIMVGVGPCWQHVCCCFCFCCCTLRLSLFPSSPCCYNLVLVCKPSMPVKRTGMTSCSADLGRAVG